MAFTKLVRFSSSVAFVLAALLLLWGPLAFLLLSRTKGSRCKACVTLSSISTKTNPKTSSTQSLYVSYQRGIVFSILVRMDFKQLIWSTKECCLNSLIVSLRLLVVEETVGFQCVYIRWVFEQQVIVCLVVVAHCSPLCNWSFFVFVNHFPTIWNQELFNLQTGWLVSCFFSRIGVWHETPYSRQECVKTFSPVENCWMIPLSFKNFKTSGVISERSPSLFAASMQMASAVSNAFCASSSFSKAVTPSSRLEGSKRTICFTWQISQVHTIQCPNPSTLQKNVVRNILKTHHCCMASYHHTLARPVETWVTFSNALFGKRNCMQSARLMTQTISLGSDCHESLSRALTQEHSPPCICSIPWRKNPSDIYIFKEPILPTPHQRPTNRAKPN